MRCDVCGAEAAVCVTELEITSGQKATRQLCAAHAQELGYAALPSDHRDLVWRLRRLVAFIRTHNRMPSGVELASLGGAGDLSGTRPGTPAFAAQLAYLEALADFIEREGRMPTDEELPDPL